MSRRDHGLLPHFGGRGVRTGRPVDDVGTQVVGRDTTLSLTDFVTTPPRLDEHIAVNGNGVPKDRSCTGRNNGLSESVADVDTWPE